MDARARLLTAALSYASSHTYFESAPPGPNDDAEMEMKADALEASAREYVASLNEETTEFRAVRRKRREQEIPSEDTVAFNPMSTATPRIAKPFEREVIGTGDGDALPPLDENSAHEMWRAANPELKVTADDIIRRVGIQDRVVLAFVVLVAFGLGIGLGVVIS